MGRVYVFQCPRCEYTARVSGGAADGYHCATQTVVCADCRALYDAVVKLRVPERPAAPLRSRPKKTALPASLPPLPEPFDVSRLLLFGEPPRTKWESRKLTCPVNASHRVEPWRSPGKCPRCGTFLGREGLPFRIWD